MNADLSKRLSWRPSVVIIEKALLLLESEAVV